MKDAVAAAEEIDTNAEVGEMEVDPQESEQPSPEASQQQNLHDTLVKKLNTVWIQYMTFSRRAEVRSVKLCACT